MRQQFYRERALQDVSAQTNGRRRNLWFVFNNVRELPDWPCCYVIYVKGELVYIGKTLNLDLRFFQHRLTFGTRNVRVKAKLCRRFGEWSMVEDRLIARLQPKMNVKGIIAARRAA